MKSYKTPCDNFCNEKYVNKGCFEVFFKDFLKLIIMMGIVFISAGKITYWQGWIYSGCSLFSFFTLLIMSIKNQDVAILLAEQLKFNPIAKWWDKAFWAIYLPFSISIIIVAGLDSGRYEWTKNVHVSLYIAACVVFVFSNLIILRSMWSNKFYSGIVRIQNERGHEVIQSGFYRFIRHPGYTGGILLFMSEPIVLGSFVAMIPASFIIIMIIIRTFLEDSILRKELVGYSGYIKDVKYRLLPGIW